MTTDPIPSPYGNLPKESRMITAEIINKIQEILKAEGIFICAIHRDGPSLKKLFIGTNKFCEHDIRDMMNILQKNPPPHSCVDKPEDPQPA